MNTAPEIEFQGLKSTPQMQETIMKRLAELDGRWGRITAGRVVVKGPGQHRQSGGLYQVHIRLALPDGREVNVERTPPKDERYADLTFAINDAFNRARRQLQDEVRRMQGQTKHHETPPNGTVVRLDPSEEFGFIESSDGQEVYFHRNSVLDNGFSLLRVGTRVTFAEETGERRPQASTVRRVRNQGLRT
jgi:cold shock CspA family protein/ribosome-associated translation inhibitor RaiA